MEVGDPSVAMFTRGPGIVYVYEAILFTAPFFKKRRSLSFRLIDPSR